MTPEEGYDLAKFQRPGRKIVMGPDAARDEPIRALHWWENRITTWPQSWADYEQGSPEVRAKRMLDARRKMCQADVGSLRPVTT